MRSNSESDFDCGYARSQQALAARASLKGARFAVVKIAFSVLVLLGSSSVTAQTKEANSKGWTVDEEGVDASAAGVEVVPDDSPIQADDSPLQEALEVAAPAAPRRTATISNRQLARNIENQFRQISEMLQREDAFSADVGELYFSYAALLLQAADYEKARDAYAYALHVEKINNGIYALEQRPALRGLFDTMFAQGKSKEFEEYLSRIVWLENQNPEQQDTYSFDLLVQVGNYFIDAFMVRPIAGETGRQYLEKAQRYLSFAVARYEHFPLSEMLMPYGEIALASTLQAKMAGRINRYTSYESPRQRSINDVENAQPSVNHMVQSFTRADYYLKRYLKKAREEDSPADQARALIQLGDLNLQFKRDSSARKYYELAWSEVEKLPADHELRHQLAKPVTLPAYFYSKTRSEVQPNRRSKLVPMTFAVKSTGKVGKVTKFDSEDENAAYFSRARRAAKKLTFRPALIDGQLVDVDELHHDVRIFLTGQPRTEASTKRNSATGESQTAPEISGATTDES
ncbi:MAG: hypothetical protein HKN50_01955 [Gammaproteobacteria bacterium]|nr:hypothetical protein [Gammaproteobacteria bacterium]